MTQLKLALVLDAIDNASAPIRRFADVLKRPMALARQGIGTLSTTLDQVSSSAAGLATAIGGGIAVREIVKDNDAFEMMRINAEATEERIEKLRSTMLDTAVTGRVSLDELTQGFVAMRAGGLSLDAAEANLSTLAATIQRLGGAQGEDIGETFAVLSRFAKIQGPDELLRGMAILREQMKGVPGGFQDFMNAAAPLISSYASQGHTGLDALRDIGGLYATLRPGMANPRQTRSAIEELLAKVADKDTAFRLESLGIDVFGHTQAEKNAGYETSTRLPISEILQQLLQRYQDKGMAPVLDDVIGGDLRRALKVPLGEVKDTGRSATLDLKLAAGGDTAKFLSETAEASRRYSASLSGLRAALQKVGEQMLSTPLRWMADLIADNTSAVGWFVAALGGLSALAVAFGWVSFVIGKFGFLGTMLTEVAASFGSFFLAVRAGYGIMTAFGLVLAANPIGVWITAIGGLVALGTLIYEKWEPIVALFSRLRDLLPSLPKSSDTYGLDGVPEMALPPADEPRPLIYGGANNRAGRDAQEGGRQDVGGEITVRFDNAPLGMRVSEVRSNNPGVNYLLDVGYALGVP